MRLIVVLTMALSLASIAFGQNSVHRSFSEGGTVRLRLSSGDYSIRAGAGDAIRITWAPNDPADLSEMKKIRVQAEISGQVATIRTEGPTKYAHMTIEIPAHSDLYLRMRAGDLGISGIEGNKDVHLTAGDLKIDVSPESYSYVHAAVTFGDLVAHPLGISKDGIKNHFDWNGAGKYKLDASLFAGDLVLVKGQKN